MRALVTKAVFLMVLGLVLGACPNPPVPPVHDAGDGAAAFDSTSAPLDGGAAIPDGGGICWVACANLRAKGCWEGRGVPGGLSCEETCAKGLGTAMDVAPACLADAGSKVAVRACRTVDCP